MSDLPEIRNGASNDEISYNGDAISHFQRQVRDLNISVFFLFCVFSVVVAFLVERHKWLPYSGWEYICPLLDFGAYFLVVQTATSDLNMSQSTDAWQSIPTSSSRPYLQRNESSCCSAHALHPYCSRLWLERLTKHYCASVRRHLYQQTVSPRSFFLSQFVCFLFASLSVFFCVCLFVFWQKEYRFLKSDQLNFHQTCS